MRRLAAVLCSIGAVLLVTTVALAANPKKGGLYSGLKPGTVSKRISLKVARNGKTASANLFCAGTLASTMKKITIRKGKFSGVKKTGSAVVWRLKGSFRSKTTASARATLTAVCDGGIVKLTLTLVH